MNTQANQTTAKPARKAAAKPAARPAKAAKPAKAAAPKGKPAPAASAPAYALGKAFAPKAGGKYRQIENWAVVVAALPATKAELIAAIKAADLDNAAGFVQARIRKGHLLAV